MRKEIVSEPCSGMVIDKRETEQQPVQRRRPGRPRKETVRIGENPQKKDGEKDLVTSNVAKYVSDKGINIAKLARETKIPYQSLYVSLGERSRGRELRAEEFLKICHFLDMDPLYFWGQGKKKQARESFY